MSIRWLVLPTVSESLDRGSVLSTAMGYPRPATRTDRASLPIEHPTNGKGAVPIKAGVWSWVAGSLVDMASLLTAPELAALYDREQMDAAGWFPPPELV